MQDLQLIGVHEDGEHLLLSGPDGSRFRLRLDEPLRSAVRRERPRQAAVQDQGDGGMRPREVQAMIRAGSSAEEVAERAGWSVEKVRKYEGPILAEREHVATLARSVRVRGRGGSGATAPTLVHRVGERLGGRGVDAAMASWDAWRSVDGPWTVVLTFPAGGRQRQASWRFDLVDRTVTAADDEARWLSEEEQPEAGPLPTPQLAGSGQTSNVYDVEADGGVRAARRDQDEGAAGRPSASSRSGSSQEEGAAPTERGAPPLDLMTAMRERSTARERRGGGRRPMRTPTDVPSTGGYAPDDALPLEDFAYDPATMALPPSAHGHAHDEPHEGPSTQGEPDAEAQDRRDGATPPAGRAPAGETTDDEANEDEAAESGSDKAPVVPVASGHESGEEPEPTGTPPAQGAPEAAPSQRPRTPRRSGRPSVPAWDDIMFGGKPGNDKG